MFGSLVEELMDLSIDGLDQALGAAKLQREQAELQIAAITAVVHAKQAHADHGHRSINGYLKQQLNCSSSQARTIRRRARLVNEHPQIADALGDGRIGVGQIDRLATAAAHPRAGHRFAEFAPILTDHAERLEYNDFLEAVQHFEKQADPDGAFNDQQFHEDKRTASVKVTNGAIDVYATGGDPTAATEMQTIFDRAVQTEVHKDFAQRRREHGNDALAHPLPRTAQQRAFDALHDIFLDSVTAPADGLRPEPVVNFVIDPNTGIEALAAHGFLDIDTNTNADTDTELVDPSTRLCATTAGTPVHPDVVVTAMLRGSIRRVIIDAHGVIIDHGRKQRLFTGTARHAARLLAVRCGHRGCDIPAEFCDIDHIDEWAAHNGETNQNNALPLCGNHDRWKHRQQLRGRRDKHGRIHLIRPNGTTIKPLGARDPEWHTDKTPPPLEPPKPDAITTQEATTWAQIAPTRSRHRQLIDPSATVQIYEFSAA